MLDTGYRLPVIDTIKSSWRLVHGSKSTFMLALLYVFLILFGIGIAQGIFKIITPLSEPVFKLIAQLIGFLMQMGIVYIGLQRAENKPIDASQVFYCFDIKIAAYLIIGTLLQALLYLPGIALLQAATASSGVLSILLNTVGVIAIIVAIYIGFRISLFIFFILDQTLNPWESLKKSFTITHHNVLRLAMIYLLSIIILTISAIPLGIGLIWTIPMMSIIYGMVYKNLTRALS